MDLHDLPIALIYPHPDARALNHARVDALAESIAEIGLLNPIIVRKAQKVRNGAKADAWEIIAGHHRYEACAVKLKKETIACFVHDENDLRAELMMIDENLCRAELGPAERAKQTARRKELYEALHPETRAGIAGAIGKHGAVANIATADGAPAERFTSATAKATGQSERSVQLHAERGEKIAQDVLDRIAGTHLETGRFLDELKKLPEDEQRARVEEALAQPKPKPSKRADPPKNDFEAKEDQVARLMAAWNKAGPEAREEFLSRIDRPIMDRSYPDIPPHLDRRHELARA